MKTISIQRMTSSRVLGDDIVVTDEERNVVSLIASNFITDGEVVDFPSEEAAAIYFVEYVKKNPKDAVTGNYSRQVLREAGLTQWSTLSRVVEAAG